MNTLSNTPPAPCRQNRNPDHNRRRVRLHLHDRNGRGFPIRLRHLASALAVFGVATSAIAQAGPAADMPTVVITANPLIDSNRVDAFSASSTRVTDAQLRDLSALDLAAGLRLSPGVQISRYNEVGSYSGDQGGNVYIRGMGTSRPGAEIKTYLDGLPLYMGVWNHPLMDLLPLTGIGAIDVQKGPQPMTSGNNFGAVNLSTKRASAEGVRGDGVVSLGSYSTATAQANVVGRSDRLDYLVAFGRVQSDGARPNADSQLTHALGRVGWRLDANWSLGAHLLVVDNTVGDPGDNRYPTSSTAVGPYSFSNGVARNHSATSLISGSIAHRHGDWEGELKLFHNSGKNDLTNDASWGTFNSRFRMTGLRWKEAFTPWKGGRVVAGLDHDKTDGDISGPHVGSAVGTPFAFGTAGSASVPSFSLLSPYIGLHHRFELGNGWTAQPSIGLRHYKSNHYASKTAPNAGITLAGGPVRVYANYAQGVLYPGPETYTITRAIPMAFSANNGWDRLSASTNDHKEVGLGLDLTPQTHLDLALFQDDVSKRYVWSGFFAGAIANPASGTWSNNYPDYRIRGVELSVRHRVNAQWIVFGGLTTLDTSIENLPFAPKQAWVAGVNGTIGPLRVALDAQHQSSMYSLTLDRGAFAPNKVDGFTVANTRLGYSVPALGRQGEVFLALNNLFNARYEYNAGYPMPGRNVRVGVAASF